MKKIILLVLILVSTPQLCSASDRITIGAGKAEESTDVVRIGLQRDFERSWYETDTSMFTGYWELSLAHWDTSDKKGDDITALTFLPVFAYRFIRTSVDPYFEFGVGIAYLNEDKIGDLDLGGKFQFETRLGFGIRFGARRQHDLALRVMHISNAGIESPNDGIDMALLGYGYKF